MIESSLHIHLFGDFSIFYEEQQITSVTATRLQSLLAYLVLHRGIPQQRQHLAFLFWPDTTEAQARNNLRQLLHQLRQVFPAVSHFLCIETNTLHWRIDRLLYLDVAEFEQALDLADQAVQQQDRSRLQATLERADSLYRGELLPGCYDEWILPERERLRQQHLQALEHLLSLLEAQGDIVTAIRYAQRLLRCDPLREDSYRHLMRLFTLNNDRASAVRVYPTCAATLQRELGVEPDPLTREAYERLLHPQTPPPQARHSSPALAPSPTLIGRQPESEQLQTAWSHAASGEPHFVLVTGEAGIGKSRLAEDFLAWANQQGAVTAKARSYAALGQLSFAPVTDWLRSDALRAHLGRLDPLWLSEIARLLPELLTERSDVPHYEPVTEYGQRQRFFEALARALLATERPLALLIDDLQWCDPETLEWLFFLLRFDPTARLLVVGCARTEELPPRHPLRGLLLHLYSTLPVTEIALQPLDAAETAYLIAQVAHHELDPTSLMQVYHATEGYPLFVVELVRAGLG
ncbi:MAG: AAA family ATPase, partial [Ktedonobacteraceae bacterium]|nr:AAA family ATPase [Ktedonobacteraceae bacterium]